jgi:aubergine-like protein
MNSSPGDQINLYQEHFAKVLIEKVNTTYQANMRLTVVMVNLRNSERFFNVSGSDVKNVFPGTLVSTCVVSKNYDFFIVSQQSTKGSVVPNHYKVVFSSSKLEEGHLQELIFSQCFNYANWTGSIKVPAILQYAKKCAKFSAEVLGGASVAEELLNKPYYI